MKEKRIMQYFHIDFFSANSWTLVGDKEYMVEFYGFNEDNQDLLTQVLSDFYPVKPSTSVEEVINGLGETINVKYSDFVKIKGAIAAAKR
jgi:hypothetical protein